MEVFPFVGRGAALAELEQALAEAREARGGLVLLTGPAGAGKTRLAEQATERATGRGRGFRVAWAWCAPGQVMGPWVQLVRALAALDDAGADAVSASPMLRTLAAGSVPKGSKAGPGTRDPGGARLRLAGELRNLLLECSARAPLLLVLDDVHDADASSLRLLTELAATLRGSRVLLLATARDGAADWGGRADQRAALARCGPSLPVGPLSTADIAQLVTAATGREPGTGEITALVGRTGGEAFFVVETLRSWRAAGVTPGAADPAADPSVGVPGSVRAVVQGRVLRLPDGCRQALEAASALGTRFRLDVLAELCDAPLAEVSTLLAPAEEAGLLAGGDPGAGVFRHQLMREAVYAGLAGPERLALHTRAAAVLAGFAERGRDVTPAEVAGQLLRAGAAAPDTTAAWACRAGEEAERLCAFDEAVHWYEAAARSGAGTPCDEASAPDQAELRLALGSARLGAGDRAGARRDFLRCAELARAAGRFELLARAALGLGAGVSGFEVELFDRQQLDLLEEARTRLPASGPRAAVTARLSVAGAMVVPDERRLALAEEAVHAARACGDRAVLAYALSALCDAQAGPDHCVERRGWAEEIIEIAVDLHELTLELLGRRLLVVALCELAEIAAVEEEILAFAAGARLLHQPLYEWYVPLWQGMRALLTGRHEDCRAALVRTEELGRRADSPNAAILAATQRWCLAGECGDLDVLTELASEMSTVEELGAVWLQVSRALVAAQLGRLDEARQRLTAVAPRLSTAPRDSEWLPMLAQAAETLLALGPAAPASLARDLYDWLSPCAGLLVVEGIGAAIRAPVHAYLAELAAYLGDSAAASHLAAARAQAAAIGAPHRSAPPGSWEPPHPGTQTRQQAGSAASPAAPTEDRTRIATLANPPVTSEGSQASDAGVFRREGEVWLLRFAGREARLRDSKGLRDLAVLLEAEGRPVPAVELAAAARPAAAPATATGPAEGFGPVGDLGETVDARARAAYRRRLAELEGEADEADAVGDGERAARVAWEREALVGQLAAAYGLGGRVRRSGSPAERARTTVTARIRAALDRMGDVHPELARHLRASVHTGTLCRYEPEVPRRWQL